MTNYQLYQHHKDQKYYRIINEIYPEGSCEVYISYQCVNDQNAKIIFQTKADFFGFTEDGQKRFTPFIPGDIKDVKLYNCVSDLLIEQFDNIRQEPMMQEYIEKLPADFYTFFCTIFGLTYSFKQLVNSSTTIQEDIKERKQKGYSSYGYYLVPFNGRNALQDGYEEHLDLLHYLMQKAIETEQESE